MTTSTGLHPWLLANGIYNHTLSASADTAKYNTIIGTLSGGLGGFKSWENSQLGGSLMASGSYFDRGPAATGAQAGGSFWRQSYVADLGYSQQVSRRLKFIVQQLGGLSDGGYGLGSGFGANGVPGMTSSYGAGSTTAGGASGLDAFGNPANNGLVDNEIFSSRTKFYSGSVSMDYQISQRLYASGWGQASIIRRSGSLYGMDNAGGGGNVQYRATQMSVLGVGVQLGTTRYPGQFGGIRNESIFGVFTQRVTRTMSYTMQAGVGRVRSEFIGAVTLPPEVAAILGAGSSLQVTDTQFLSPVYNLSIHKIFELGTLILAGGRSFSAGNGFVQAGIRDTASINFGRALTPKLSANLVATYFRMSGRVGLLQVTETAQVGGMASYRFYRHLSLTAQAGTRYVGVTHGARRLDAYAGVGIGWSPGDHAFSF
ncbi:MAG TPA: hypothetical protein VGM51_03875 [Armatimonadota bacterium]|jgi:hypothetical protein